MNYEIEITGMSCEHCAASAAKQLNAISGVSASVSYDSKLATINADKSVSSQTLLKAIESKGFGAVLKQYSTPDNLHQERLHIAIVGTGSGALAAAIKAVEQGARVTIIEGADVIGGTCVNIGCVPSKIFIHAANIAHLQGHHAYHGVPLNTPVIDRQSMVVQQQRWVDTLRHAKYESILESNSEIALIRGIASLKNKSTLTIKTPEGNETELVADKILLAVGARPFIPPIKGLAETPYWTSTEALQAETLPKHLIVLGGSVVAVELAQAFAHLGCEVTLMTRSTLLSKEDPVIGQGLHNVFEEEGIKVLLHTVPEKINFEEGAFSVTTASGQIKADQLLVATGRQSNADTLGLDSIKLDTNQAGDIVVDDHMRTSINNIYAAGDCTTQPQFVYVAAAAGTRAARNMTGDDVAIDLSIMPTVVFTEPPVASVGMSEQEAQSAGIEVESRTLPVEHVPRAIANFDTRGFIKLVAEKVSGRIVGCQLLVNQGGEIIQTAALAIRHKMTIQDLADQLFPYLTMVEGLKLTAQTFNKDVTQLSCCAG